MGDIPDGSNFFASLHTPLSRRQVAELFAPLRWRARRRGWADYEVICPFAELVIEAESSILLHGPIADVWENAEHVLVTLRDAGVAYTAESYDEGGRLLREYRWGTD
jgi:hypothetical protein